jgi:hypothetical protein
VRKMKIWHIVALCVLGIIALLFAPLIKASEPPEIQVNCMQMVGKGIVRVTVDNLVYKFEFTCHRQV